LINEKAGAKKWAAAAIQLVAPPGLQMTEDGVQGYSPHSPYNDDLIRGRSLRDRRAPSVTEMLQRRVVGILAGSQPLEDSERISYASYIALALYRWDQNASLASLQACSREAQGVSDGHTDTGYLMLTTLNDLIVSMSLARLSLHDPKAMSEYVEWLKSGRANEGPDYSMVELYEPFWRWPDDPQSEPAVRWLTHDRHSPALANPFHRFTPSFELGQRTPALGFATVREALITQLRDPKPLRTTEITETPASTRLPSSKADKHNLPSPRTGATRKVIERWCDEFAEELSLNDGMPEYDLAWSMEKRDAVILVMIQRLNLYGDLYRWDPANEDLFRIAGIGEFSRLFLDSHPSRPLVHLRFPALDHPASEPEVAQGRAIFSLAGTVRIVKGIAPMPARFIGAQDVPGESEAVRWRRSTYASLGAVWQIEEQKQPDGSWKRFYGFAGPGMLAAIPADKIELLFRSPNWKAFNNSTDYSIGFEGIAGREVPRFKVGSLPAFQVKVRNRLGTDRAVSTHLLMQGKDGRLDEAASISIGIFRQPDQVKTQTVKFEWPEVKPKIPIAEIASDRSPKMLATLEEALAGTVNLRSAYPLDKLGMYEVRVYVADTPEAGATLSLAFEIVK